MSGKILKCFLLLLILLRGVSVKSETHTPLSHADSVRCGNGRMYRFDTRQLIVPGVAVGLGVWGAAGGWMKSVDRRLNNHFHFGGTTYLDDVMELLPLGGDILIGECGVKTRYSLVDRAFSSLTALVMVEASVQILKHTVRVRRPDGSDCHSFPSGHSAVAFMGAELMRIHYGGPWGWGAYGVAAATAVLRLGHERHWLSDVLAGAGIGILSARAAMWLLPAEQRLFRRLTSGREKKNGEGQAVLVPYADHYGGGLAMVYQF